jgi:hypothetical protein
LWAEDSRYLTIGAQESLDSGQLAQEVAQAGQGCEVAQGVGEDAVDDLVAAINFQQQMQLAEDTAKGHAVGSHGMRQAALYAALPGALSWRHSAAPCRVQVHAGYLAHFIKNN